ncbi:nuclease-related domain-containing protein [Microbacterium sp. SL62]|uniref:nuclease-related domain-containing protein n=1 Tax=Microbacterium sp. SL62 TaxID=2995139 RepID=UPI0022764817|nr:nuclease-related domain-containing protein [Microbacterium sp. SL62]MCY1718585.1 nuclease-related domain-containing protein [Microbacterium sp. SL62]
MTLEQLDDDKKMRLRYAGTCRSCGEALDAGAQAVYSRTAKSICCLTCAGEPAEIASSTAGGSARREYERRKATRERRIRERFPRIGGRILALFDDPQSTTAWKTGAVGEEHLGTVLAQLPDTFRVLHDRRIPRTRANIDHIVIGPAGVWVVDAKRYVNKRPSLRVDGGIFRPRVETLRIGGRDGTKLVDGVSHQVNLVSRVLGDTVPVFGALCFVNADWPLIGGSFVVDDVQVLWPKMLLRRLAGQEDTTVDVDGVHAALVAHFPPA